MTQDELMDKLSETTINALLSTSQMGRPLTYLDRAGSTSQVAYQLASEGAAHGQVVVADYQDSGRGRLGRAWFSPPGMNLYFSVILRPQTPPERSPEFTLVAAVALCEALQDIGCQQARIKWPNDVEINGKKVVGILTELSSSQDQVNFVVVGIGVDVNMTSEDFPAALRDTATSVRLVLGRKFSRAELLVKILQRFETWIEVHQQQGFGAIRARWTELSSTLGSRVHVAFDSRFIEGTAEGIDESGCLVVRTPSGFAEHIIAGEVTMLRV